MDTHLVSALEAQPKRVLRAIRTLSKHPTDRNRCYTTGYLTALSEVGLIEYAHYALFLALVNRIAKDNPTNLALEKILKELP